MVSLADLYTPLQSKNLVEESAVKLLLEYLSNNAEVQDEVLHGHCIPSIKTGSGVHNLILVVGFYHDQP